MAKITITLEDNPDGGFDFEIDCRADFLARDFSDLSRAEQAASVAWAAIHNGAGDHKVLEMRLEPRKEH